MQTHRLRFGMTIFLWIIVMVVFAAEATANRYLPKTHPEQPNEDLRTCTVCHHYDEPFAYGRYNHTLLFAQKHGILARSNRSVCEMCHRPKKCALCHSTAAGLKPELKVHGNPKLRTPHRGDYLSRHRIDGQVDPTACFRCHGRPKSAKRCRQCHR